MKIVRIFEDKLFAFHYDHEEEHELRRLLDLWTDVSYLYQILKEQKKDIGSWSIDHLAEKILTDAESIDDTLKELSNDESKKLEHFFKPLDNSEYQFQLLSKQKGRKDYLRIYALKIDDNCFVVTGGAIKFTQFMKDRDHTQKELQKLESAKQYLKENGVSDSDSFFELLLDQNL